jgi:RecB family exonuclease
VTDKHPLAYEPTPIPEDGTFKISPSQFSSFIQTPHNWYRTEVLEENEFSHNTSTVLGTIVHYCAEQVSKEEEVDLDLIHGYINSLEVHEEYDPLVVMEHFTAMAEELVNSYVLENTGSFMAAEKQVCARVAPGFYAAGTIDRLEGTKEDCMIVDYKTYNSKTKPKTMAIYYRYQLLVYAWILKHLGYNVTRIRLVYVNRNIDGGISEKTGKPLKSYPPEVTVITETIADEDFEFIEGLLDLAVDSVTAAAEYPQLTHVIFHDPRLKQS